ncbi:hypothetical protein U9M48_012447 [Paspalum notatum var. saurae]|uniref:Uncharacterized protein n=1 Tax=Paspalum notatum var. saurae TaxID=547442 RepID=A0AAQ3SYD8_PASNO
MAPAERKRRGGGSTGKEEAREGSGCWLTLAERKRRGWVPMMRRRRKRRSMVRRQALAERKRRGWVPMMRRRRRHWPMVRRQSNEAEQFRANQRVQDEKE